MDFTEIGCSPPNQYTSDSRAYNSVMDSEVDELIDKTGLCVPLAARIVKLLAESGASQMEMSTALDIVNHLRQHLRGSLVPEGLTSSWSAPPAYLSPDDKS